ncbi:unnamed protein product [Rotaria sp. Silwood1]|nr:unnamed protein product [Rotaria sp. Silwood1]CAF1076538.1 unnamed protein product [Rotaria sp. Silwood1]CAF3411639.1 unnamed protein product [Rotaria sp. Silwood1]CAF3438215.1 unnamed protein product [Rotaria sp. Silwood1]CAF3439041.1 unnamed protein product [Rotaria sp. Silwood1]
MTNISTQKPDSLSQDTNRSSNNDISSRQTDSISSSFHSRYWIFLFDNLKRSIEQIYQTCESDQNPLQCQEVTELLCQYCKNFEILMKKFQHIQNLDNKIDEMKRNYLSQSLITLPFETDILPLRPFEHSQSICNDEIFCSDDLLRRQKRLHNSDINLNVNKTFYHYLMDTNKFKRQKSNKYRKSTGSSSLLSLPSSFSSTTLTNDSSMTLITSTNQLLLPSKQMLTEETAGDADDEKDIRDETVNTNRPHRYYHQLSTTSHYRLNQQNLTSEDDDEELLLRNHRGMIDFMDRQIFDAFDQEESLAEALEAEQERTIASLMAEQEDLEHQLNNVSDDDFLLGGDDGSELEESELSTTKTSSYFMSLHDDGDEKDISPNDLSREDNDSEPDGKSRTKLLRIQEKLSSPSRIRPLSETLREAAERQARAFTRRQTLRDEKARKMRELTHRVNEVRQWKEELIKARKTTIEMKMHRAEEKRQYLLFLKAKKAGDEDLKGQEIAFIKLLQQENRRQTLKERYQKEEQFKQFLEEERVKKHDEHKQRELAAENRRKELEAIRQTRLNEMQEKWKTKERMIEQHLIEKRKQKQTAAIAKQKSFQQKRAEHVAYLKASTVELKKKLALKQEESARRHITQLEEIRRKAMEMATFRGPSAEDHHHNHHVLSASNDSKATTSTMNIPASEEPIPTRKLCTLCNLLLASDLHLQTHLRGTRHNQLLIERFNQKNDNGTKKQPKQEDIDTFNVECITIVTNDDIVRQEMAYNRERKHAMKKRAKKLRLRMTQRSVAYEAENAQRPFLTSTHKARIQRFLNELEKSLNTTARKEPLNTTNYLSCQRILTEFVKIFDTHGYEKDSPLEQRVFFSLNGYTTLTRMIELRAECNKLALAPENLIALTISVYRAATNNNLDNAMYVLNSGKILTLVESLVRHLTGLKIDDLTTSHIDQSESEKLAQIDLVTNLAELLADLLTMYNSIARDIRKHENETNEDKLTISRLTDFISYMANVGVLDRIASFFRTARAIVNTTKSRVPDMIIHLLNLLQQMVNFSKPKVCQVPFGQSSKKSTNDSAQVLNIMKSTNFCEILSLIYGILIHETDNNSNNQMNTDNNSTITVHEKTFIIVINSMILLNTLAILDLDAFQTTLGEETISLQLRHVANYILAYCNHQQTTMNDNLLRQIILLIGYYCVLNQDNQCRLAFGNRPTVLQQLSCLPFRYFVESKYMDILFPTLIACSFDCETTRAILQTEMSLDLVGNYIQTKMTETTTINEDDIISAFHMRFPRDELNDALKYYQSKPKITTNQNQIEPHESITSKKQSDEQKENESPPDNNDIKS